MEHLDQWLLDTGDGGQRSHVYSPDSSLWPITLYGSCTYPLRTFQR